MLDSHGSFHFRDSSFDSGLHLLRPFAQKLRSFLQWGSCTRLLQLLLYWLLQRQKSRLQRVYLETVTADTLSTKTFSADLHFSLFSRRFYGNQLWDFLLFLLLILPSSCSIFCWTVLLRPFFLARIFGFSFLKVTQGCYFIHPLNLTQTHTFAMTLMLTSSLGA